MENSRLRLAYSRGDRLLMARLPQGDFVWKVVVAHFHHKHSLRHEPWKRLKGEVGGLAVHLLADHNSRVVKGRDVCRPPELSVVATRDLEAQVLSEQGLSGLWSEVHNQHFMRGSRRIMSSRHLEDLLLAFPKRVGHRRPHD